VFAERGILGLSLVIKGIATPVDGESESCEGGGLWSESKRAREARLQLHFAGKELLETATIITEPLHLFQSPVHLSESISRVVYLTRYARKLLTLLSIPFSTLYKLVVIIIL
jgi:hypothetical protein